jgi:hypothetical protein
MINNAVLAVYYCPNRHPVGYIGVMFGAVYCRRCGELIEITRG